MKKTKTPEKINNTAILAVLVFSAFIALFNETSLIMIMLVYIVVCIGVGCTMTSSQTKALSQLPKEAYPHGIAILNTLQQIAAAIGSSLFIGIMSASQLKALNNAASQEVAIATGFSTATLVLAVFVFVAFCLSFALKFDKNEIPHKSCKS